MIGRIVTLTAFLILAFPQTEPVALDGIITQDGSESPLPSVQVRLVSSKPGDMNAVARAVTGTDGRFRISSLH